MRLTNEKTGRRSAQRGGNTTAQLLGGPVDWIPPLPGTHQQPPLGDGLADVTKRHDMAITHHPPCPVQTERDNKIRVYNFR
jgi:hypothetical protein